MEYNGSLRLKICNPQRLAIARSVPCYFWAYKSKHDNPAIADTAVGFQSQRQDKPRYFAKTLNADEAGMKTLSN